MILLERNGIGIPSSKIERKIHLRFSRSRYVSCDPQAGQHCDVSSIDSVAIESSNVSAGVSFSIRIAAARSEFRANNLTPPTALVIIQSIAT